jgi:23S rRNA (cytosine1962-C5)-methyltransferase
MSTTLPGSAPLVPQVGGAAHLTGRGRRRWLSPHPWIYADDVRQVEAPPGALVRVHAPDGAPLGLALYSSRSRIALRRVTRSEVEPGREPWLARARQAVAHRRSLGLLGPAGACRLVGGDAEGFPGWIVDRYADVLVLQSGCQGSDALGPAWLECVLEALAEAGGPPVNAVLDRSDSGTRGHEGLEPRVAWVKGAPREVVEVEEPPREGLPALVYEVAPASGHKTGHYLDQVENRARAARFAGATAGQGGTVLDAFAHDGLFGIRAAQAGAREVVCVDQSQEALARAERNAERNGVAGRVRTVRANAMHDLRERQESGERHDLVIVDPPAFARSRREVEGALRGYRELGRRALGLLQPGGVLVMASCSFNVSRELFVDGLAAAALDAGVRARLFELTGAGPDHPVGLGLPESDYLKCAFVRSDPE